MSAKADDIPDEWVLEVYSGTHRAWSMSGLNEDAVSHTLDWCMNTLKVASENLAPPLFAGRHRYRLRNVVTGDILMGGIL